MNGAGSGRLAEKVAIVTGSASGMGEAIVRRFVAEGARVLAIDLDAARGAAVAEPLGDAVRFHAMDVADVQGWQDVRAMVQQDFGRLDVLINNAGVLSGRSIATVDSVSLQRTMAVNLEAPLWASQMAVGLMEQNPGGPKGSIVNIASTASFVALADDLPYAVSKAAVAMLTKSIAVWCGRASLNIRCNCLHPGAIRTGIHDAILGEHEDPDALLRTFGAMSPLGRMGTPDEIAAMALFLASDESSFVTGGSYLVDGGMLAVHPGT